MTDYVGGWVLVAIAALICAYTTWHALRSKP